MEIANPFPSSSLIQLCLVQRQQTTVRAYTLVIFRKEFGKANVTSLVERVTRDLLPFESAFIG